MEAGLQQSRQTFLAERARQQANAMQRVALQIIAGIDIEQLVRAPTSEKKMAIQRLTRLIERERLRGLKGHWSYDLNRHIGLKQVLDTIQQPPASALTSEPVVGKHDA